MRPGDPMWTEKVEESDIAQDPLAMNRVMNRLLEDLLPAITTISPRARYYAHHLWAIADAHEREDPENRAALLEAMYRRERLLMLASVHHAETDLPEERNHNDIVGTRSGTDILDSGDDPIPLDFRFVSGRSGSYGRAYVGPLQTMGLVETPEGQPYEQPADAAEELVNAYAELAEDTELTALAQQETITRDELKGLALDLCLCRTAEDEAPDREALRDLFLGRTPAPGHRTQAQSRRHSLLLLLHLARRSDDGAPLTTKAFLDACYFSAIETEDGYIPANIPDELRSQAAQWKVLRAHDYLAYTSEALLEAWLAYLESDDSPTIPGFKESSRGEATMTALSGALDLDTVEPSTPLTTVVSNLWPEATANDLLEGRASGGS